MTSHATNQSSRSKFMCKTNRSGKSAVLNKRQMEMVFASLPEKYSLLAEILYFSAGRVSEVTNLKVNNINFTDGLVTFEKSSTKTKETRQVPLPPSVLENLSIWVGSHGLKGDDYIFFTNSRNIKVKAGSKAVTTQSVDSFFRKAFDWNGILGASTHSFRRSRLTHLHIKEKWSLREIMDISGHKNLLSLQQYLDTDKNATFEKYRKLIQRETNKQSRFSEETFNT